MKRVVTQEEYDRILAENIFLKEQNRLFRSALFAVSSEKKIIPERIPEAIDLWDSNPDNAPESTHLTDTENISYQRKKRSKDEERQALPEHLERRDEVIELSSEERNCPQCETELSEIGEDITEELEVIPMQVYVRRIIRKKYVCKNESLHGVYRARMPARIIPKGMAGPSLLSHILISKYVDHLPLERQEKIFQRHGIRIAKTTMSDWMRRACEKLEPLLESLKSKMLDSRIVNCDETTLMVQNNARGGPKINGYLWSYIGDSKWVWFDWREGRGKIGPLETLNGFTGNYLQSDGYAVYENVVAHLGVEHLGCWAHARRKFVEAFEAGNTKAEPIIRLIAKLYGIEKHAREMAFSQRMELRKEQSVSVLKQIRNELDELATSVVPKGALGKAISYTLTQWDRLTRYCEDGELSIDNNIVERAIRPVALGRKNWLFAGSPNGAQWAAGFYSLIETAKLHGVDPGNYLTEVLRFIVDCDGDDMMQLLPNAYAWRINNGNDLPPLIDG